ncbi:MAG: hypothetical protein CM1200mP29_12690 [Verrucomicrobiota bacterium]|nr:MAG: hypothetical protein CM1200mP29_12690 [Verrucomicrobiota bacterium]
MEKGSRARFLEARDRRTSSARVTSPFTPPCLANGGSAGISIAPLRHRIPRSVTVAVQFQQPNRCLPGLQRLWPDISIDYRLAMPDLTKSIAGGVVKPWQTGTASSASAR